MNKFSLIALPVAALFLTACQTTSTQQTTPVATSASASPGAQFDISSVLTAGMTKDEVLAALGQPNARNDGLNNSLWTYDAVLVGGGTVSSAPPPSQPTNTNRTGATGQVASGVGTIVGGNAGRILRGLGQIARSTPRSSPQPATAPSTSGAIERPKIDVYFDAQGLLTDYQSTLTQ